MRVTLARHLLIIGIALSWQALSPPSLLAAQTSTSSVPYLEQARLNLPLLLGPPPAQESTETQAELQLLEQAERERTSEQARAAAADSERSAFRFANVMGAGFTADRLPLTAALLAEAADEAEQAVHRAKEHFARPRPYAVDHSLHAIIKKGDGKGDKPGAAYPSGHSTFAYVTAILLAQLVPEKSDAIFARAADFAHNRIVAGVHYPSDVAAGRISGTVVANLLLQDPRFQADLTLARAETRQALGLPPLPLQSN